MFIPGITASNIRSALAIGMLALHGCSPPNDDSGQDRELETSAGGTDSLPIDRHEAMSAADGTPGDSLLEGAEGTLEYERGCLFLARNGVRTGLVMPGNASFDGTILRYRNEKLQLGQTLGFTGDLVANKDRTGFACKTPDLLKVAP